MILGDRSGREAFVGDFAAPRAEVHNRITRNCKHFFIKRAFQGACWFWSFFL